MIKKLLSNYNGRFIQKSKTSSGLLLDIYDTLNDVFVLRVIDYMRPIINKNGTSSPDIDIKSIKEELDKYLSEERNKKINQIIQKNK